MEQFAIQSPSHIAIMCVASRRYIRRESSDRLSGTGCHPFLHTVTDEKARLTFAIALADELTPKELAFCSSVFIKSEDGAFLSCNPGGEVFLEAPSSSSDGQAEALERNLMKFRRWTIINRNNLISKKIVVTTDEVLFKSAFGNYLRSEGADILANATLVEDKAAFSLHHAEFLPRPNWAILRPFQSQLHLNNECLKLFIDNELFFSQLSYAGGKLKTGLKFDSMAAAEKHVLEETLYALMSADGQFIKRRFGDDHSSNYKFEQDEQFDVSFVQMINRILPLARLHDRIRLFERLHGGFTKKFVLQAFCDGLGELRQEFYGVLNAAEAELATGELDAPRLWYYLQGSFKSLSAIDRLLVDLTPAKTGTCLSMLYNWVITAVDALAY